MKALLWKDYRLNRTMLISSVVIGVVVYLVGVIVEVATHWPEMPTRVDWSGMLNSYGVVSLFMTYVAAAMFSGNAVAVERSDRSAHFLAYLPPEKWRIMASKFAVAAGVVAIVWGWALVSVYVLAPGLDAMDTADGPQVKELVGWCVLAFGAGWMSSAELEKPVGPIVIALASPAVVGMLLEGIGALLGWPRSRMFGVWVNLGVGAAAFVLGSWRYMRRVEP